MVSLYARTVISAIREAAGKTCLESLASHNLFQSAQLGQDTTGNVSIRPSDTKHHRDNGVS